MANTILTADQLAARWKISASTARRWAPRLPGAFKAGAQWRFRLSSIEALESAYAADLEQNYGRVAAKMVAHGVKGEAYAKRLVDVARRLDAVAKPAKGRGAGGERNKLLHDLAKQLLKLADEARQPAAGKAGRFVWNARTGQHELVQG